MPLKLRVPELELKENPIVLGGLLGSLFSVLVGGFALLLAYGALPARVPLLFTSSEELTPRLFLFLIPLLSLFFVLANSAVSEVLLRKGDRAAALFPAFISVFVSVIMTVSLVSIIRIFPIPPLPLENDIYGLLAPAAAAAVLGIGLTYLTIRIARRFRLLDRPHGPYPKVRPVPRLGALPIFLTFAGVSLWFSGAEGPLLSLIWGAALVTLIQVVDDIRPLSPLVQGAGHILAALIVVGGGVGVEYITNPIREWIGPDFIRFDAWRIPVSLGGWSHTFTVWSDLFTVLWIFAIVNVVDWLDGMDGLAAGVGIISSATIVVISILLGTPATALLGAVLLGTLAGFLPLNFFPAQIYLGGGAFLLGYLLAVLAVFSGAKTGTALLVLAVPIIDAAYVIYQRVRAGRSPFVGDQNHLHHRLMEAGLKHPQIVLLEWGVVAVLAIAAFWLKGFSKLAAVGLVFVGVLIGNWLLLRRPASKGRKPAAP